LLITTDFKIFQADHCSVSGNVSLHSDQANAQPSDSAMPGACLYTILATHKTLQWDRKELENMFSFEINPLHPPNDDIGA